MMLNRLLLLLCTGSLLLLLSACGDIPVSSTANSGNSTSGPTNSSPATKTDGPVSITTDHSAYSATLPINITVTNTLSTPIYALDGKANCSILALELQTNGVWKMPSTVICTSNNASKPIKIESGKSYTTTIQVPPNRVLASGTYRVVLEYSTGAQGGALATSTATVPSVTFTVGATSGL